MTYLETKLFNLGVSMTDDIFIVEGNMYVRTIRYTTEFTKHPGNVTIKHDRSTNEYLCVPYKDTEFIRHVDAKTFYTHLSIFQNFIVTDPDIYENLLQEMIDYDLGRFMINSRFLFPTQ